MPASKVRDHAEIRRWFEEGVTYPQMVERYLTKYHVETRPTMFANIALRHGWERRAVWNLTLMPWNVLPAHKGEYPYRILTQEARRRSGKELTGGWAVRVDGYKRDLAKAGAVIHYDPERVEGFLTLPARPGIDTDLVRVPDTVRRRSPSANRP